MTLFCTNRVASPIYGTGEASNFKFGT